MRTEYVVVGLVIMLVVLLALLLVGSGVFPAFKSGIEGMFGGLFDK